MELPKRKPEGETGTVNVLTRYIVKEVLKGSSLAALFLLTLFSLFTFSDELKSLGKGSYNLKEIVYYVALTSPRVFYELVPASALLGSLFVLGGMGNHRELVAMRASGVSVLSIIKSVMLAGAILVAVAITVGEWIAPNTEQMAQTLKSKSRADQIMIKSLYGLWLREGQTFINVKKIEENGDLENIYTYELDENNRLSKAMHSQKALFKGANQWEMENIQQSDISTEQVKVAKLKSLPWKSSIDPKLVNVVVVSPDNLSLYDLNTYIRFLKDNKQKSQTYEFAFWGRVVNPFVTFVMLMIATPFVIGVKRGVSAGARMLIGVVIGLGFNIGDKIIGHMSLIYDLNPAIMAFVPSLTVFTVALYALRRVQ